MEATGPRALKGFVLFRILTKGIYTTFTRAVKEAVSNAYDAGASNVEITFDPARFLEEQKPSELTIQIRDDGKGMSLHEFWDRFASIESEKDPTKKNSNGRYPIGQFGIGSFALLPFSLELTIYSKQYHQPPIRCLIDTANIQKEAVDDYASHVKKHIRASVISEEEWKTVFDSGDSGTVIVIKGVTNETYEELVDGVGRFEDEGKRPYPNAPFTTGLKEIAWELSTLLPLVYAKDPGKISVTYETYLTSPNEGIQITLSEVALERQIHSSATTITKTIDYNQNGIKARGVLVASEGPIQPRDANGVLLRLNNVGIGTYDLFGLVGQATIRARLTGEVHILSGLHDSLNAPRDRFSGPKYKLLRSHILESLQDLFTKAYAKWETGRARQVKSEEKVIQERHKKLAQKKIEKPKAPRSAPHQQATTAAPRPPDAPHPPVSTDPSSQKTGASPQPRATVPAIPQEAEAEFSDPVQNVRDSTGHFEVNEQHALFKKFKGAKEKETMKVVLRALYLADLPKDTYQLIIRTLLELK